MLYHYQKENDIQPVDTLGKEEWELVSPEKPEPGRSYEEVVFAYRKLPEVNITKTYRLGFEFVHPPVKVEKLSFPDAVKASWKFNKEKSLLIGDVIRGMLARHISVRSLSGPIGIGQVVHQAVQMEGWMPIIGTMAYISINLGIMNLLPIPILDGGMILFLLIESAMRRDLNQQVKERVYQVAFVCLLVFAAMVIFNDLTKLPLFNHVKP